MKTPCSPSTKPSPPGKRLPPWFRIKKKLNENFRHTEKLITTRELHTVCEEARCPNRWDCWGRGTATFMILGDICTRSCGFCSVSTGRPEYLDTEEPLRVAAAVRQMNLRHVVITSVNRDELPDGGAGIFARTVREIRRNHSCSIELLIPDFKGDSRAAETVFEVRPEILNHNTETVPRLYRTVRPQGRYRWTLDLLSRARQFGLSTKSGLMVGLGETREELFGVMDDLRGAGCDILTIGQYLQPTRNHLPVHRYYHPDDFLNLKNEALAKGFRHVESGPLVRSSFHAEEQAASLTKNASPTRFPL
ncbi:MAG TPA: lipoyl synthase [Nitrospiria bacterium]